MKKRINITVNEKIHTWAQDYLKKEGVPLSTFLELKLIELSCSVCYQTISGSAK